MYHNAPASNKRVMPDPLPGPIAKQPALPWAAKKAPHGPDHELQTGEHARLPSNLPVEHVKQPSACRTCVVTRHRQAFSRPSAALLLESQAAISRTSHRDTPPAAEEVLCCRAPRRTTRRGLARRTRRPCFGPAMACFRAFVPFGGGNGYRLLKLDSEAEHGVVALSARFRDG